MHRYMQAEQNKKVRHDTLPDFLYSMFETGSVEQCLAFFEAEAESFLVQFLESLRHLA